MYTVTDLALWYKDFQAHLPTHNPLPKKNIWGLQRPQMKAAAFWSPNVGGYEYTPED